jgi:hypothetical protein
MNEPELASKIATLEVYAQVFGVLVAIGIVGEVAMGIRLLILNKRQQRQTTSQLVEARSSASNALARAAAAERKLADRHLSPQDRSTLVAALQKLPRSPIAVYFISEGEPGPFAGEIIEALQQSGFTVALYSFALPIGFPRGVTVLDQTSGRSKPLPEGIVSALQEVGVEASPTDKPYGQPSPTTTVSIFVGQK